MWAKNCTKFYYFLSKCSIAYLYPTFYMPTKFKKDNLFPLSSLRVINKRYCQRDFLSFPRAKRATSTSAPLDQSTVPVTNLSALKPAQRTFSFRQIPWNAVNVFVKSPNPRTISCNTSLLPAVAVTLAIDLRIVGRMQTVFHEQVPMAQSMQAPSIGEIARCWTAVRASK